MKTYNFKFQISDIIKKLAGAWESAFTGVKNGFSCFPHEIICGSTGVYLYGGKVYSSVFPARYHSFKAALRRITMNKKMNNILLVLAACILLPALSYAAFEPVAIGARPAAMGGAYTAIADDVYSVYYNPAGLSLVPRMEFTTQYSQLYTGLWDKSNLNYSFLGLAQPLMFKRDFGTVGLSVLNFTAGSLYRESTITLSYGRNFKIGGIRKLDVGFNVKSLTIGYGTDEYTYDSLNDDGITHSLQGGAARADSLFEKYGFSKSAVAIDIGVKYALFTNYKLGLMISNINEPGIAQDSTSDAKLPRMINLGFAHNGKGYLVSVDYMSRQVNKVSDSRISIAAEKLLPMGFGLRSSVALGSRELTNFAVGFGYQSSGLQIDYALEYPISGIKSTMGNHKVSLTLKFGPVMHVPEEAGALQVALEKEQKARAQTEVALAEKNKELEDARKEIMKLKGELEELLSRPVPVIPTPAEQKPAKAEKEAPAVKPAEPVFTQAGNIERQYLEEYNLYRKGASKLVFTERIGAIRQLVNKYKGKKIDVSSAEGEYKILLEEQKNQQRMYVDSLTYYRKMVAKGIDSKTQADLLKKIISRYEQFDIDVSEAKRELSNIK